MRVCSRAPVFVCEQALYPLLILHTNMNRFSLRIIHILTYKCHGYTPTLYFMCDYFHARIVMIVCFIFCLPVCWIVKKNSKLVSFSSIPEQTTNLLRCYGAYSIQWKCFKNVATQNRWGEKYNYPKLLTHIPHFFGWIYIFSFAVRLLFFSLFFICAYVWISFILMRCIWKCSGKVLHMLTSYY